MALSLAGFIESLERIEHEKNFDPFTFVAVQRAFFDGAIELLEQNNSPETKKLILKQLKLFENIRDRITPRFDGNLPIFTQFQLEILDSVIKKCIKSYNRMQTLLKKNNRKTKSRMYV